MHGRRATAVAVVLTACLHRDLTCPTDPVRAAVAVGGELQLLRELLLLMLLTDHGRNSLAAIVLVKVVVAKTVLTLLVVGDSDCVDYPPVA